MAILVTSKHKEDRIKTEGARVATTQNIDFSNTQGQVTLKFAEFRTHPRSYGCPCCLHE